MRRKFAMLAVSLVAATIGMVFIASPAQAAVCNSGTICFYDLTNQTVLMTAPRVLDTPRNFCIPLAQSAQNKTSYIRNRENVDLLVYDNSACDSLPGLIHALSSGPMRSPWNDTISAWCYCT